jgi:hypothetical protein
MHGQNLASGLAGPRPFAPRRRYYPAADQSSGACPLSSPVEVCLSIRPFTLLQ